MKTLNDAVTWIGTAVIFTALIVSFRYSNKNKEYMKGFLLVILIVY